MISVIVPVYNVEKYIRRCIDSICNQTYRNLEIILVDDGSTDLSGEICDEYEKKDSRIRVIHQSNQGLSGARNTGLDNANGDYIAFVDSDDYIHYRMFEVLIRNINKTEADVSVASMQYVSENGIPSGILPEEKMQIYEGDSILSRMWQDNVRTVVVWNKLYKRFIFNNLRFQMGRYHEDTFIIHRILVQCKRIVYSSLELYYYVQHTGSIMNHLSVARVDDAVAAYEDRITFLKEKRKKKEANMSKKLLLDELLYLSEQQVKSGKREINQYIHNVYQRKFLKYFLYARQKKYFYYFISCKWYMRYNKIP